MDSEVSKEISMEEKAGKEKATKVDGKKKQRIQRSKLRRYLPHVLVGTIVVATLRVVLNSLEGWPTPVQLHVIFGVVGYQVFMGHGTLIIHTMAHKDFYFFPNTNKKKLHWITTGIGGIFALAGNAVIYNSKEEHFNSIHGILGALALLMTLISAINGTVFLYWQELGISKGLIKFIHLLTGLATFILATVCLMYGYNKKTFLKWTSPVVAYSLMAVCLLSLAMFSLSPGKILLNKLMCREHDDRTKDKRNGDLKDVKKD